MRRRAPTGCWRPSASVGHPLDHGAPPGEKPRAGTSNRDEAGIVAAGRRDAREAIMTDRMHLVCISRAAAAGGEEIGRVVAKRLGITYVDEEIIRLAAEGAGIDPTVVAEAEIPKSLVTRLVDAIDSLGGVVTQPGAWLARPSQKA